MKEDYAAERDALRNLNGIGLHYGFAAGILSFVFLRRFPPWFGRWAAARRSASSSSSSPSSSQGSYTFSNPSMNLKSGPTLSSSTNFNGAQKPSESFAWRAARVGLDALLSLYVAAFVSSYATDPKKILDQVSEVPLVSGRSIISDELCDDFILEHGQFPTEFWHRLKNSSEDATTLTQICIAMDNFVTNCKKRRIYEKELQDGRFSEGLQIPDFYTNDIDAAEKSSEGVNIPPPGVPRTIDVSSFVVSGSSHRNNTTADGSFSDESNAKDENRFESNFEDFENEEMHGSDISDDEKWDAGYTSDFGDDRLEDDRKHN